MIKLLIFLIIIIIVIILLTTLNNLQDTMIPKTKVTTIPIIYLDNNGTTKIFNESLQLMDYIYKHYYGNASGVYKLGSKSKKLLETCRNRLAKMLQCAACEIYFTSGATESNNIAIRGVFSKHLQKGKHIVTTTIEHPSVDETVKSLHGADVTFVPVDKYGKLDLLELENAIRPDTILVTVIMGNNEIGTLQNIRGISEICKRKKVHFHCDMTQVIGKYKIDLTELGVDSATGSGHKFHGPKACGFLFLKKGVYFDSCQTGGHQEKNIRAGTENIPGIVGMTYSLYLCYQRLDKGQDIEIKEMRDWIKEILQAYIPGSIVNGHPEDQMYNTLSMCLPVSSRKLINLLDNHDICINTGSACSKGKTSQVLDAIGVPLHLQEGSIRMSLGFMNTFDECRTAVKYIIHYYNELLKNQKTKV